MNKYCLILLLISSSLVSGDLKIADDFAEGDILSAETFNQIFDTIEKINRTIVTEDLIGTWSCDAMTTRQTAGWTDKSLYYLLEDTQVNFAVGVDGSTGKNVLSTSSPSPFKRQSSSFSGEFLVVNNKLFTKSGGENESRIWSINFISESRFELTFLETSAQSFPANYASFITCDTTVAVPAAPTSPSAVNAKTSINLTWEDSSVGETGFKVYRKQGSEEYVLVSTQSSTSYSDSDTSEGVTYSYYISSYNENGESKKSKVVSATLDSIYPTIVNVSPQNGDEIKLADSPPIVITFSEPIQIICPEQYQNSSPGPCSGNPGTITTGTPAGPYGFLNVGEKNKVIVTSYPLPGYTGSNFTFTATIFKDFIYDMNGNQLQEDYTWQFTNND